MILSPVERMLAWRYLRARRRERFVSVITLFSIIGITLGVATLILVTSLMNGIRHDMTERFLGIDGHISIYGSISRLSDYDVLANRVRNVHGVRQATPKVQGQVMAANQGVAMGAQVLALPLEHLLERNLITDHVTEGDITSIEQRQGVVLGEALAHSLRVSVGDKVTLISPEGRSTIAGLIPRMKAYPVVATVKLGMHMYDSSLVLMPFEEAQIYFKYKTGEQDTVTAVELMLDDTDQAGRIADELQEALGGSVRVYDWQRANQTVFSALNVQRNVMVIILALIVLVAAFNIISSLIMLVKDKTQDIAILRTVGASRRSVMRVFMASGTFIGVVGTALGVVLGLLLATYLEQIKRGVEILTGQEILIENIYFLSTLPTRTDPVEVVVIIVMALGLSFLATLYPAWRAAKLDPVEALRYE